MASQITNYKCPACTGPLHFAGASGMLECDFCGAKYDVAQIEALYAEKEAKAVAATEQANAKAEQNRQKWRRWSPRAGIPPASTATGARRPTA